jgi:hypothetical protein
MDTFHQFPKQVHINIIRKQAGEDAIIHKTIFVMKRTDLRIGLQKITPLRIFIIRIIRVNNQGVRQTGHVAGMGTRNVQTFWLKNLKGAEPSRHIRVDPG